MIVIIDYGMGNLRSILNKIAKLEVDAVVSSNPNEIDRADKLILPGVGHFARGMENLRKSGILEIINKKVMIEKTDILGICLGMQLFTKHSEEGNVLGLGWVNAETKRFNLKDQNLRVPHMGWNTLDIKRNSPFLKGFDNDTPFYFAHSYSVCCNEPQDIVAITDYGYKFTSVIQKGNIFGTQFHPEKSHKKGMGIIKNFLEM